MKHDGSKKTLGPIAVGALFGLAVLNEFVTSDPGVPLARPQVGDILGALVVALIGASAAWFLDSRSEGLRPRSTNRRLGVVLFSIAAGVAMGLVILGQMVVLAEFDADSRQRYAKFISEPLMHPIRRTFSAAVIEEVLFRYFGMTAIALLVAKRLARPHLAYPVALISSAAIFGVAHLPALSVVGIVIVIFNMLAGLLYGWMFWHWGWFYPMLGHFAAGSVRGIIIESFGERWFA